MNFTHLHQRLARTYQRMLAAKTWAWECRWADLHLRYLNELHGSRTA